jgi:hypothetical protein
MKDDLIARLKRLSFTNRNSEPDNLEPDITWRELNEIADVLDEAIAALASVPAQDDVSA